MLLGSILNLRVFVCFANFLFTSNFTPRRRRRNPPRRVIAKFNSTSHPSTNCQSYSKSFCQIPRPSFTNTILCDFEQSFRIINFGSADTTMFAHPRNKSNDVMPYTPWAFRNKTTFSESKNGKKNASTGARRTHSTPSHHSTDISHEYIAFTRICC